MANNEWNGMMTARLVHESENVTDLAEVVRAWNKATTVHHGMMAMRQTRDQAQRTFWALQDANNWRKRMLELATA